MEKNKTVKGVVFSRYWYDVISLKLLPSDRLQFYDAVFDYAFNGCPPPGLSPAVDMAFSMVKPFLDTEEERYRERCERNRLNARGRKPIAASGTESYNTNTNTNTDTNTNTNTNTNTISLDEERERFLCLGIIFGNGAVDAKGEFDRFWNYYESLGWRNNKGAEIKRKTSAASMWQPEKKIEEKQTAIRSLWYECISKAGCNDIRVFLYFRTAHTEGENLVITADNVREFAELTDSSFINQLRRFATAMGCTSVTYRE